MGRDLDRMKVWGNATLQVAGKALPSVGAPLRAGGQDCVVAHLKEKGSRCVIC